MSTKVKTIFRNHIALNGDKIKDRILNGLEYKSNGTVYIGSNVLVELVDGSMSFNILFSAEELIVPLHIVESFDKLNISDTNEVEDNDDAFIYLLHNLFKYCRSSSYKSDEYMITESMRLIIDSDSLRSDFIRDTIYSRLGLISDRVIYNSPDNFNFY